MFIGACEVVAVVLGNLLLITVVENQVFLIITKEQLCFSLGGHVVWWQMQPLGTACLFTQPLRFANSSPVKGSCNNM